MPSFMFFPQSERLFGLTLQRIMAKVDVAANALVWLLWSSTMLCGMQQTEHLPSEPPLWFKK